MDYDYYKSRIEAMQSNNVIDIAENLWQCRSRPVNIHTVADGLDLPSTNNAIATLRRYHGFIIKIKEVGGVTLIQLLGFDTDLSGDSKPVKRTDIDFKSLQNKLLNGVFKNE